MYIYIYLIFLIHLYIHYINIYRVTLKLLTQKWNIINTIYIFICIIIISKNSNNIYINYKYYIFIILLNNIISI